jgi:hypothetical protein
MTPPERRLWNALKLRADGFKFRKQHEHGPYYLDFFCYEAALAVEAWRTNWAPIRNATSEGTPGLPVAESSPSESEPPM